MFYPLFEMEYNGQLLFLKNMSRSDNYTDVQGFGNYANLEIHYYYYFKKSNQTV